MAEPVAAPEPVIAAASAPPASEPSGYMQSNGDFGDNAPDVIKNLMEKKQWTNAEQMATGYTELETFKGGAHTVPEAEDTEGWAKIDTARGVPETFDKYEYSTESGVELSDDLVNGFKQMAFDEKYTPAQLKSAIDFQLNAITAQEKVYTDQMADKEKADVDTLKTMYGVNYESAVRDAGLTANKHGFSTAIESEGLKGIPIVTQMLNHIANLEAEDGIGKSAPADPPKSLDQQMEDIKSNPAFTEKFHKDHKSIMVTYNELCKRIALNRQAS